MMVISGKTRVCGVIGDPIEHTLSPTIHNAAFNHLKLDFVFLAFRVEAADLENAIRGMRGLGIHGLAKELAEALVRISNNKVVGGALSSDAIAKSLQDSDVLINATSVGMHPEANQSIVPPQWLRSDLTVMDIVYNPVETKLARDAKAAGAKVISGVEMLIYQGAASFEVWTGRSAPIEVMRKAALSKLSSAGESK